MDKIRLQNYGLCDAKPAQDFKPGEFMKWNGGSTSEVLRIRSESEHYITFLIRYYGFKNELKTSERRIKKTRLVAIGGKLI